MDSIRLLIDNCFTAQETHNISDLQNNLFHLYTCFNKPGCGTLIVNYPDKVRLGECFTMMLRYDWMNDKEIREVWAENAFYCYSKHICNEFDKCTDDDTELAFASFDMLLLLRKFGASLKTKFDDIIFKSSIYRSPIFDYDNYKFGADTLISDFAQLSIQNTTHFVINHQEIINKILPDTDDRIYYIKTFNELMEKPLAKGSSHLLNQMRFICDIIEDILNKM